MELNLQGRCALITGGSKGIGYAIAEEFAREGVNVNLVSRTAHELESAQHHLKKNYQVKVNCIPADLSNSSEIQSLLASHSDVDILINNAGAIPAGDLESVDEAMWRNAWDLKVYGYINMTRAFFSVMKVRKKPGVIINITGLSGIRLDANYIAGSSGNACLETFTRTAGAYSMDHGVRILSVSPGAVQTDRIETLMKSKAEKDLGDAGLWKNYFNNLPLQRPATATEVANLVVFLASDQASYISGVVYHVDGGHGARGSSFA